MPAYKSHHYVPRMYMRLFSGKDAKRVGVYVIRRGKFVPNAPISGQLCRDYFYGKDPGAEKALAEIEDEVAPLLTRAIGTGALPLPGSADHERLVFYLGMQHCRTVGAADQHDETSEKVAKAMLRRQAELEGKPELVAGLDLVRIRRTNAVSEVLRYATIGASLLSDLRFILLRNDSVMPFVGSDTPVVLHNRLFENQPIAVTGYANVGLQLFLPLGARWMLFGFDDAAYDVQADEDRIVRVKEPSQVRLLNDLQWEQASSVILASPDTPGSCLDASASYWAGRRERDRTVVREEVIDRTENEVRTRLGSGQAPSSISLDLAFVRALLPAPAPMRGYEVPPFRDPGRVARVDRAFALLDDWESRR